MTATKHATRLVFGLACAISFLLYLHRYAWGFVKSDLMHEFHWDDADISWLDGLFLVSYAPGQIPSGMLCDWFGARVLLGSSILAWSLLLACVALATSLASMAAVRLAFGAAQASCYPALNKVSKNWFPVDMRTTAQGWIATFFGRMGGAVSFFLLGTVLMGWLHLPWRWAIGIFTALGLVCGAVFLFLFRNTPSEHPWASAAEAAAVTAGDPAAGQAAGAWLPWTWLLASGNVWFLFLRAWCSNMADVVFVYWVPRFLRDEKGLLAVQAGWMAALPLIGGACGGAFSGWLQSRFIRQTGRRRWARRGAGLAGKGTAAVLILATLAFREAVVVAAVFLIVKFFADWEQPAEWGTISDIAGRGAATLFGWVNMIGSLGGVVGGVLAGRLLTHFSVDTRPTAAGWNTLFLLIAVEYVVASTCWLFIDCEKPIDAPRETVA